MTTDDERRRAPRSPIEDTLFIQSISSRQVSMTASTINASTTGLQVELESEVLVGAEIALWINADSGQRTLISGVIRWNRPSGHNRFLVSIELDAESAPTISNWLNNIQ